MFHNHDSCYCKYTLYSTLSDYSLLSLAEEAPKAVV